MAVDADACHVLPAQHVHLGQALVDRDGVTIGSVDGTWPLDGGGEPEFALVRIGRFGETRLVPLAGLAEVAGLLYVPFTRREVEDGPALELGRFLYEQVDRARTYYLIEIDDPISLSPAPG